jgi:hypothetical protein
LIPSLDSIICIPFLGGVQDSFKNITKSSQFERLELLEKIMEQMMEEEHEMKKHHYGHQL